MLSLARISFEVLTEPIPLARPRVARGHAYLPKRSRDFREVVQQAARIAMNDFPPMTGALFCKLEFFRKFAETAPNYGDLDNHCKAIFDALNGICYVDDRQIVGIAAVKRQDKDEPRIAIDIGLADFKNLSLPEPADGYITLQGNFPRICPTDAPESPTTHEFEVDAFLSAK